MSGADALWFLFSAGGAASVLGGIALWSWIGATSRRSRWLLTIVAAAYFVAGIFSVPHAIGRIIGEGYRPFAPGDAPPGVTVVVLLGASNHTRRDWSDQSLSVLDPTSTERTLEAVRLYHLLHPAWVISSGGPMNPGGIDDPSAVTMAATLTLLGVPREQILLERESRTTREEAQLIAAMLTPLQPAHVVLVTSSLHMRRSVGVFRALGVDVIPAIARDWTIPTGMWTVWPTEQGLRESARVAHELVGLGYYRLRGWYK